MKMEQHSLAELRLVARPRPGVTPLASGFDASSAEGDRLDKKRPNPLSLVCLQPILPGVVRYRRGLKSVHPECMKVCNTKAGDKKGGERTTFMSECLKADKKS